MGQGHMQLDFLEKLIIHIGFRPWESKTFWLCVRSNSILYFVKLTSVCRMTMDPWSHRHII